MRHKLRTSSTMKIITYVFFIYVSITAFYGVSAYEPQSKHEIKSSLAPKKSQCDLQSIIKKSKYVGQCSGITTKDTLPEMGWETRNQYLCTQIFGTVDKICNLNLTSSINSTSFDSQIEKLGSSIGKNISTFCSQLTETLIPNCNIFCNDLKTGAVDSLCVVVHWQYNILATSKTQVDRIQDQHTESTVEKITQTLSKDSQSVAGQPAKKIETALSPQTNSRINDKNIDKSSSATLDHNETHKPADTSTKSSEQISDKNVGDSKTGKDKIDDNKHTGAKALPGHKNNKNTVKPVDSLEGQKVDDGTKSATPSGKKNSQESIVGDESPNETENGEEEIAEDAISSPNNPDLPLIDEQTPVSHHLAQTVPASNLGKEDKLNGKDQVETEQESIVPQEHIPVHSGLADPPQHFFAYFMAVSFICILCYIGYHKKHKIMGIIFEGRKSRGGRGRRRPNTAGYRKLDCNLEEAVTSQCNSNVTHVIY